MLSEAELLKQLDHPNIVKYKHVWMTTSYKLFSFSGHLSLIIDSWDKRETIPRHGTCHRW